MNGWEILLGATLEAGLGLLAEAGFGEEIRGLKERLTGRSARARQVAFDRAFEAAVARAGEHSLRPLLNSAYFRDAVITGLLDPVQGFDVQAAVEVWEDQLPAHAPALRRFFSALESALLADEHWGPILERYQAVRFQSDVLDVLRKRNLDLPSRELVSTLDARLSGDGAIAQEGGVAAGARGVAVGGNVGQIVQVFVRQVVMQSGSLDVTRLESEDLRSRYLAELARESNRLSWTSVERDYADPEGGEGLQLADVYTALDTTELERVEREEELRRFLAQLERGEARRIPAQEVVNREARLVLLGDPGSGKSTFVNHLAYVLAQAGLALGA
jgi:hypothetical protein